LTRVLICGEGKVERFKARFDLNVKLERKDGVSKAVDPVLYQSMIGGLLYAAIATRPDISQAVGVVSKYTCSSKPSDAQLTAARRIQASTT